MRTKQLLLPMLGGAILALGLFAHAADQSYTGTVSDSHCGMKHGMAGLSPAACTRACVKSGADYALVVGDKVYTLKGDPADVDKFAGKKATVMGSAKGDTIMVASVSEPKK